MASTFGAVSKTTSADISNLHLRRYPHKIFCYSSMYGQQYQLNGFQSKGQQDIFLRLEVEQCCK